MTDPTGITRREAWQPPSWTVLQVDETGSTNADLLGAAEAGIVADRTVLRADYQHAGRGRLDRRWEAPPGANLLASILFTDPPEVPSLLTQAVGRAALDAVETLSGRELAPRLALKWPNDLLLDDQKLAGVLAQRSMQTGAVVVGIGLNVSWAPDGAASLEGDLGVEVAPHAALEQLLVELHRVLAGSDVMAMYRARLSTLGARVRVELPGGRTMTGQAVDLDGDGRLVVTDGTELVALDVGDIVHLRAT